MTRRDALLTRRRFVVAGGLAGLLVGCVRAEGGAWNGQSGAAFDGWLHIGTDGRVRVHCGRSELGQGCFTGVATLVADELDCRITDVAVETGFVDDRFINVEAVLNIFNPNTGFAKSAEDRGIGDRFFGWVASIGGKQVTGGSSTMIEQFEQAREAAALVRHQLIAAAAAQWKVPPDQCATEDGKVWLGKDKRDSRSYGALAQAAAAVRPPSAAPTPKPRSDWRLIGKPGKVQRLDIPAKVSGKATFGIDMRPGKDMLFAAVANCPVFDGKLKHFDATTVRTMQGVAFTYSFADAVAVVADSTWHARSALQQAIEQNRVTWEHPASTLSTADIEHRLAAALARKFEPLPGAREYRLPYLAHATMEPMNCTARVTADRVEVWAPTQAQTDARDAAAQVAGVAADKVTVSTTLSGGGFGRRLESDLVAQAVRLAKRAEGRPVQVVWSREEDIQHDFYRPAAIVRIAGTVDRNGTLIGIRHQIASQSIIARILPAATLWRRDQSMVEGATDLPYDIASQCVESTAVELPVPVGYWRSVGHSITAFANETFVDEMAQAAGADPVAYRLRMLKHDRLIALLRHVAKVATWAPDAQPPGCGQGVAMHLSFGSAVAMVAEVAVEQREIKVTRVVAAVDCGTVINPDIVMAQIEGSIAFGLSAALFGKITIKDGKVVQRNFADYEMVRMHQMPRVEVHIMPSEAPPGGIGEPGVPPVAPAVANAIFAATGRSTRIRSLPILDLGYTA